MALTFLEVDEHLIIGLVSDVNLVSFMLPLDEFTNIVDDLLLGFCLCDLLCFFPLSHHLSLSDDALHLLLSRFVRFSPWPADLLSFLTADRDHGRRFLSRVMVLSALETFVTRLVQLLVTASRPTSFHLLLAGVDGSALE